MAHAVDVVNRILPIDLLEDSHPEQVGLDVAGQCHHGGGINESSGHRGGEVRGPRSNRGGDYSRDSPVGPEVAISHVTGALLMLDRDRSDPRVFQRVKDGNVAVPRNPKRMFDTSLLEELDGELGAVEQ